MSKSLTTRIITKHDTKAHWDLAVNFVPLNGEIIVYDDLKKFKVGDGVTTVSNLTYFNENKESRVFEGISTTLYTANNKVATVDDPSFPTTLYDGLIVEIRFTRGSIAEDITLNINGTGAYPVWDPSDSISDLVLKIGYPYFFRFYKDLDDDTHSVWNCINYAVYPEASTSQAGIVQLQNSINSTATKAATPSAVANYLQKLQYILQPNTTTDPGGFARVGTNGSWEIAHLPVAENSTFGGE